VAYDFGGTGGCKRPKEVIIKAWMQKKPRLCYGNESVQSSIDLPDEGSSFPHRKQL